MSEQTTDMASDLRNHKEFTVIIPFYGNCPDRKRNLDEVVSNLKSQTFPREKYYMIMVVDAHTDASILSTVVDEKIEMKHRLLFNKSWFYNRAIRHAPTEWVVFMDADMMFDSKYFSFLNAGMNDNSEPLLIGFDTFDREDVPGKWFHHEYKRKDIIGGVWCVKKSAYWDRGAMCENFDGYGGEDGYLYERHKHHFKYLHYNLRHPWHLTVEKTAWKNEVLSSICRQFSDEVAKRVLEKRELLGNPDGPTEIWTQDLQARRDVNK